MICADVENSAVHIRLAVGIMGSAGILTNIIKVSAQKSVANTPAILMKQLRKWIGEARLESSVNEQINK